MTVGINVVGWMDTQPENSQFQITVDQNKKINILGGQTVQELVHASNFWSLIPLINLVAGCAKLILGGMMIGQGNYALGIALILTGTCDALLWPLMPLVHIIANALSTKTPQGEI